MQNNNDAHDAFVAAFTSRTGVFISTYLPLLFLLGAIVVILLRPDVRELLHPENSQQYFVLICFFGGILVVVAIESVFGLVRSGAGNPALIIDSNGMRGRHAYLDKIFMWDEIGEIFTKADKLYVARKPKTFLERFTQKYTRPGGRYRFATYMQIPLENIDKSLTEINFAIHRYAPKKTPFARSEWTIAKESYWYTQRLVSAGKD